MRALLIGLATLRLLLIGVLIGLVQPSANAGVDDCLKAALNTANPEDLQLAAAFAYKHPSCLQNLVPPTLVPYVALSASLDGANQSGALNPPVGLNFQTYEQCTGKLDPGKATMKQLAPVLKPVCSTLNMSCQMFEGAAANQVNSELSSQVPLLGLLPCSCAAATSGLGVEKIKKLVEDTKQCGATLAQVAKVFEGAAKGVYNVAGDAVDLGKDALNEAQKLGQAVLDGLGEAGCAVSKLLGGCKSTPPSYKDTAQAICKSHQGVWWAQSKTGGPSDVFAQCMDGFYCWNFPGESLQCKQNRSKAQRAQQIAEMKAWCPQRAATLAGAYQAQCKDSGCQADIVKLAHSYKTECNKDASATPENFYPSAEPLWEMSRWTGLKEPNQLLGFQNVANNSIRDSATSTPQEVLATYNCKPFLGRPDESLCPYANGFQVCRKYVDANKMKSCRQASPVAQYPLPIVGSAGLTATGILTPGAASSSIPDITRSTTPTSPRANSPATLTGVPTLPGLMTSAPAATTTTPSGNARGPGPAPAPALMQTPAQTSPAVRAATPSPAAGSHGTAPTSTLPVLTPVSPVPPLAPPPPPTPVQRRNL